MPTIYVNIGSNSGDRHALIEQAVAAIASAFPNAGIRRSDYIETEPWGYDSDNMFLNLGLAIDLPPDYPGLPEFPASPSCSLCDLIDKRTAIHASPGNGNHMEEALWDGSQGLTEGPVVEFASYVLRRLQRIEKSIDASPHRDENGNYIDRAIDIDIIAIDGIMISTPELILPHPRMHLREFVLKPLRQLIRVN